MNSLLKSCKVAIIDERDATSCYAAWQVGKHFESLKKNQQAQRQANSQRNKHNKQKLNEPRIKTYASWGKFLQENFATYFARNTDLVIYAQRRMKIYKLFTELQVTKAHIDFTTAYFLCSFDKCFRDKWMSTAACKLVTYADISAEAPTKNNANEQDAEDSNSDKEKNSVVAKPRALPPICTAKRQKKMQAKPPDSSSTIAFSKAAFVLISKTQEHQVSEVTSKVSKIDEQQMVDVNHVPNPAAQGGQLDKIVVATDYMAMYFRLKDLNTPDITLDLQDTSHEMLRKLAGECGLQTSRSSKVLRADLQLIKQGQKEKIPLCNWRQSNLVAQPLITLDQLKTMINLQNVPDLVKNAVKQYREVGYVIIPKLLTEEQVQLAKTEWNYHTLSRGVDLNDAATWDNVKDQHDWKQGWAKWLNTTGVQIFANTHPLLYMIVALLNNNVELLCNLYEAKIHLPHTGGAFFHNDLNWFKYYELTQQGVDVDAVQSPQMVVFLSDTVVDKAELYIIPSMYRKEKCLPLVKDLYEENYHKYKAVSAMNITELCPELLQECIPVRAKAGDILMFHPRITHGICDNRSDWPQLRCYPSIGLANTMPNSAPEVMHSYTTGSHPKKYAHFYTGNAYKQKVAFARSSRPYFAYPVNHIAGALLGIRRWDDNEVQYNLCALFSANKQLQDTFIQQWIVDYFEKWKAMVAMQISLYGAE